VRSLLQALARLLQVRQQARRQSAQRRLVEALEIGLIELLETVVTQMHAAGIGDRSEVHDTSLRLQRGGHLVKGAGV
jgi:hypothetical protein